MPVGVLKIKLPPNVLIDPLLKLMAALLVKFIAVEIGRVIAPLTVITPALPSPI